MVGESIVQGFLMASIILCTFSSVVSGLWIDPPRQIVPPAYRA